ncbi:hypothetical protein VB779_15660 [Haloarculaceae archaeon H-GB11]|nr:hypothetical protein [Haloarculaceae archaeon H-GB11]
MSEQDIEDILRREKRSTRSIDSQIHLSHWFWENDIGPSQDGLKRSEVEDRVGDELDYAVGTLLDHLEDVNLIEEFAPPGPDTLVIAEWLDDGEGEVVNGNVGERAREGLEALAREVESDGYETTDSATVADGSGQTLRGLIAGEFTLVPEKVEEFLRTASDPVDTLNKAVDAIEEHDNVDVGDGYGSIVFINMPYRYRLTDYAVSTYEL